MTALTGLNTYVLKTRDGYFLCPLAQSRTTGNRDEAAMYLWQPEHLEARVAEISKLAPWAGVLRAERAR